MRRHYVEPRTWAAATRAHTAGLGRDFSPSGPVFWGVTRAGDRVVNAPIVVGIRELLAGARTQRSRR